MDLVPGDKTRGLQTPVWAEYKHIVNQAEGHEVSTGEHGVQGNMGTWERRYMGNVMVTSCTSSWPFIYRYKLNWWRGLCSMNVPKKPLLLWQQGK